MKTVVSVSLGSAAQDYDFTADFLGQKFRILRRGTDQDTTLAGRLIREWDGKAAAIGLGMVRDHQAVGPFKLTESATLALETTAVRSPVTTGLALRQILHEWAIRHTQADVRNCFDNCRVLFFSGMTNYRGARVLAEYTSNMVFADPVLQLGIPKFLSSFKALEAWATGSHHLFSWKPPHILTPSISPIREWNHFLLRRALEKAHVIAARYESLEPYGSEQLGGKILLTSTISDERLASLAQRGVAMVVDYTPHLFPTVVGVNVIEALILAALGKSVDALTEDDFLEIITTLDLKPRILYPNGPRRKSRFAFVIHPLSQQYFTKARPLDTIAKVAPPIVMNSIEKAMAYAPPFVYSKVDGIRSPTGAEAEGWLITVGGTPKEIMAHSPEFTYRRLLAAARMAKRLGAQIMGLGAFTKVVGDAGVTVARRAPLPITTGNSYSASGALWAAHEAVARIGLVKVGASGRFAGKAMVVGATGAIGSVCARLLAKAVDTLVLVSPEAAKLLALKEDILRETPTATLRLSAHADRELAEMDMVVTATSGAGKRILDIMKVKPGCVITDVARPLDIPASDVARRPDVLVIESGEIALPGQVAMKNIGLPPGIAYACLAETIVLALEGRFENFTLGRNIEWEKVREIYKLGIKHGMKLATISGVNGVYTDEDFQRVRRLALQAMHRESIRH